MRTKGAPGVRALGGEHLSPRNIGTLVFSAVGVSGQSPAVGSIASAGAPTRSIRAGRPDESVEPMRASAGLPLLGPVSVFRADWAEKRA